MPEADFRILLSHSPDQFPRAASKGVDLVLAGHNHGGQIRLPVFGPILMPSRYSRHFDRGFFRSGPLAALRQPGGRRQAPDPLRLLPRDHPLHPPRHPRRPARRTPRERSDAGLVRQGLSAIEASPADPTPVTSLCQSRESGRGRRDRFPDRGRLAQSDFRKAMSCRA